MQPVGRQKKFFPGKLHAMLDSVDELGLSHGSSWVSEGRAFAIHNPETFMDKIAPRFFDKQTHLRSFHRQLSIWGFTRLETGSGGRGVWYHKHFLRDDPDAVDLIKRVPVKNPKKPAASSSSTAPGKGKVPDYSDYQLPVSVDNVRGRRNANGNGAGPRASATAAAASVVPLQVQQQPRQASAAAGAGGGGGLPSEPTNPNMLPGTASSMVPALPPVASAPSGIDYYLSTLQRAQSGSSYPAAATQVSLGATTQVPLGATTQVPLGATTQVPLGAATQASLNDQALGFQSFGLANNNFNQQPSAATSMGHPNLPAMALPGAGNPNNNAMGPAPAGSVNNLGLGGVMAQQLLARGGSAGTNQPSQNPSLGGNVNNGSGGLEAALLAVLMNSRRSEAPAASDGQQALSVAAPASNDGGASGLVSQELLSAMARNNAFPQGSNLS